MLTIYYTILKVRNQVNSKKISVRRHSILNMQTVVFETLLNSRYNVY
jgi:hypothetical protein